MVIGYIQYSHLIFPYKVHHQHHIFLMIDQDYDDAAEAIKHFYDMGEEKRKECGEKGVEFVQMEEIGMTAEQYEQPIH